MRLLLTFMAMAALVVSIGCDNKPAEPEKPATTETSGGAGETKAPETGDSSATSNTSETQTVSINLPGMTWGGCASSVKKALETVDGVSDIVCGEPSPDGGTCSFSAPSDFNVEETLNKLVDGGASKIKGWTKAE